MPFFVIHLKGPDNLEVMLKFCPLNLSVETDPKPRFRKRTSTRQSPFLPKIAFSIHHPHTVTSFHIWVGYCFCLKRIQVIRKKFFESHWMIMWDGCFRHTATIWLNLPAPHLHFPYTQIHIACDMCQMCNILQVFCNLVKKHHFHPRKLWWFGTKCQPSQNVQYCPFWT